MIEIKNLKKITNFSMNEKYYSIIEEEKKQELLLKDNFLNKFGFDIDKIVLNLNDFLLRYQIQDQDFEDFIYSKKEIDFSISISEKKEKLEYSIKNGMLITTGCYLNNNPIDIDYKKKLTNQILKNITEMISFIEGYKILFISIIKRILLNNLYLKDIYKYKNTLNNFKQNKDKINQDFENFILKLKKNKNKNQILNFLIYDKSYSSNFQCNVLNISYKKEGYFYGFNKITKNDLFILFKNSFYINNEYYHNLESEEQVKVFKYINSKKFIEQLELINKLESF